MDYRTKILQNPEYAREAAKGDLIMEVTESICEILEKEKITRKELASRLNKTKGYVSQLLNGDRNMTLGTLAEILYVLERRPAVKIEKTNNTVIYEDSLEIEASSPKTQYNFNMEKKAA